MKHTLILSMLSAALLGGRALAAEGTVYRLSELSEDDTLSIDSPIATIAVDAANMLKKIECTQSVQSLTIDYQTNALLGTTDAMLFPAEVTLNITTTVDSVAAAWEDILSAEGGFSMPLCYSDKSIGFSPNPTFLFFGHSKGEKVMLGQSEVVFKGVIPDLSALQMNEVGLMVGSSDIQLAGVIYKDVPEPATGTLGLLALASLAARRRKR